MAINMDKQTYDRLMSQYKTCDDINETERYSEKGDYKLLLVAFKKEGDKNDKW